MPIKLLFALVVGALPLLPAQAGLLQDRQGRWMGNLVRPDGSTIRIGADLFTRADGRAWASVSSPDQDSYDIPVRKISETPDTLELDFSFATMQMRWAGDRFESTFRQGGRASPVSMHRIAEFPARQRAQTPVPPFPYREQMLAIPSAPGVTLGATLTIPATKATGTVVVLVHGSGPQTRDALSSGHRPFAVLADYLARRGIATLRYDKRGIARSSGNYEDHTLSDLAVDLDAVVRMLKGSNQFARIGIIAHSEGPEVAARVAAAAPDLVDFIISMAGVGLTGMDAMLAQDRLYAQDQGVPDAEMDALMAYVKGFYAVIVAHSDAAARSIALNRFIASQPQDLMAKVRKYRLDQGTLSLGWAVKPFLRVSLMSNAPESWRKVRCPVLLMHGALDRQVAAKENLAGLLQALRAGASSPAHTALLPHLNHTFQTARTGREDEYEEIEETLAPSALQTIAEFIERLTAPG